MLNLPGRQSERMPEQYRYFLGMYGIVFGCRQRGLGQFAASIDL